MSVTFVNVIDNVFRVEIPRRDSISPPAQRLPTTGALAKLGHESLFAAGTVRSWLKPLGGCAGAAHVN